MAVKPPNLEKLRLVKPPWKGPPPRIVGSLFSRCIEVIMSNCPNILQKACRILPPSLLRYLLYLLLPLVPGEIDSRTAAGVECLVRYWPFETLKFDFISDNNDDSRDDIDTIYGDDLGDDDNGLVYDVSVFDAIALGLYYRVFDSPQSVDQATSGTKQFIVDLSMVSEVYDEHIYPNMLSSMPLQPFMNLCLGVHPLDQANDYHDPPERVTTCTGNNEKVLIKVSNSWETLAPFINTSPCALISNMIQLPCDNVSVDISVLQALETMTSLHFLLTSSNCGAELARIFTYFKEKGSFLNEITIMDGGNLKENFHFPPLPCRGKEKDSPHDTTVMDEGILNMDFSIPSVPCHKICLDTGCSSLFDCACCHVQSLVIGSSPRFDSKVSKIIEYNCESLLDLQINHVEVAKNSVLLLQKTLHKCHALVELTIYDINANTLATARLHEIFSSIQGLVTLEHLSVSDSATMFGEDLCALYSLLYQGVPKLTKCELSFRSLVIRFRQLKDPKFKSIQELLAALSSSREEYINDDTEEFAWNKNQTVHTWLANRCCNVNFQLRHTYKLNKFYRWFY